MNWQDHKIVAFWARISQPEHGCWEWQGATNSTGYGTVGGGDGKTYTTHRVAAWLVGLVPTPSAPRDRKGTGFVRHDCDNRRCCRPSHFLVGTYAQNQQDAYNRARRKQPKSKHANAKLTSAQVQRIRGSYTVGLGPTLSTIFGVSETTILNVASRRTYADVV